MLPCAPNAEASRPPSKESSDGVLKDSSFHRLLTQVAQEHDRVVETCRAEIHKLNTSQALRIENGYLPATNGVLDGYESMLNGNGVKDVPLRRSSLPCSKTSCKDLLEPALIAPPNTGTLRRSGTSPGLESPSQPVASNRRTSLDSIGGEVPIADLDAEDGEKMNSAVGGFLYGVDDTMLVRCSLQGWSSYTRMMRSPASFALRPAFSDISKETDDFVRAISEGGSEDDDEDAMRRMKSKTSVGSDGPKKQGPCSRILIPPGSSTRISWDLSGTVFLAYDIIMIPLSAFGPDRKGFISVMEWATLLFWSMDMFLSVITGVVVNGATSMNQKVILKQYAKTWFGLDVIVVVPDWVFTLMPLVSGGDASKGGAASSGKLLRALRIMRTIRLLRLAKLQRLLLLMRDRIDSETTFIAINILKYVLMLLMLNHFLAAAWFSVGSFERDSGNKNWIDAMALDVGPGGVVYNYLTSLHWSICMFTPGSMDIQPTNVGERSLAILVLVCGLVVFTSFISSMSAAIVQLKTMHGDKGKDLWMLRRFLRQYHIEQDLSFRVLRYVDNAYAVIKSKKINVHKVNALGMLTDQLKREVQFEAGFSQLSEHPLFERLKSISKVTMFRLVGKALAQVSYARTDILFSDGGSASSLYLVATGELRYIKADTSRGDQGEALNKDDWLCEPALWTAWVHLGQARASCTTEVVSLASEGFISVIGMDAQTRTFVCRYARGFVENLNEIARGQLTDVSTKADTRDLATNIIWETSRGAALRGSASRLDVTSSTPTATVGTPTSPTSPTVRMEPLSPVSPVQPPSRQLSQNWVGSQPPQQNGLLKRQSSKNQATHLGAWTQS